MRQNYLPEIPQEFKRGDLVEIVDERSSGQALIDYSYFEKYGGSGDHHTYAVIFTGENGKFPIGTWIAWFYPSQMTLIEHRGEQGIADLNIKRDARLSQEKDIEWIVANWDSSKPPHMRAPGASMRALSDLAGAGDLWGKNGEGISWYENASILVMAFDPYIKQGVDAVRKFAQDCKDGKYLTKSNPVKSIMDIPTGTRVMKKGRVGTVCRERIEDKDMVGVVWDGNPQAYQYPPDFKLELAEESI